MRTNHHRPFAPPIIQAQLPASPLAPRQARATVRQALDIWGLSALSGDAELLASELVANAAEHADGTPIGLSIRRQAGRGGRAESSARSPTPHQACAGPRRPARQ